MFAFCCTGRRRRSIHDEEVPIPAYLSTRLDDPASQIRHLGIESSLSGSKDDPCLESQPTARSEKANISYVLPLKI